MLKTTIIATRLPACVAPSHNCACSKSEENVISQDRLAELLDVFKTEFVQTDEGARHFAKYVSGREAGRRNFAEVQAAAAHGTDVTDLVLLKLLPHMDTAHNRNRGAWCHIAPAVTKDIRAWFENVGWTKPEDWPVIAQHIFAFVTAVNDNPGTLSGSGSHPEHFLSIFASFGGRNEGRACTI
jgi:hypothetical protein